MPSSNPFPCGRVARRTFFADIGMGFTGLALGAMLHRDGYANVASDGVDALLTPPGDVEALGRTLTRALAEPQLRAGLLAAAELRAQEFSMHHLGEAYAERYERLA